jgi:anti-sigma factor RsiW
VKSDSELLQRYLDGELPAREAEKFRARLAESAELRAKLEELRRVGSLVRRWASAAEQRAGDLLTPTLERVHAAERRRARYSKAGYALLACAALLLPWSRHASQYQPDGAGRSSAAPASAAIERVEATAQEARVFTLGGSNTPVVWLTDDEQAEDAAADQDPG